MRASIVLLLLFLAVGLVEIVYAMSKGYSLAAGVGPVGIGALVVILAIVQVIREVRGASTTREVREASTTGVNEGGEVIPRRRYFMLAGWIAGILVGIYLFGMVPVLPLFVFLYIKLHGWGWILSISAALGMFALLYGVFEKGMELILYRGIFL